MANISAKRYVCAVCGGEYIVTREGSGTLSCCGQKMTIKEENANSIVNDNAVTVKGARYNCSGCGTQILCIIPGNNPLCCGKPLERKIDRIDAVSE